MKTFGSLKILEQGMEIVSTTHQLASEYTQTDMAGLIKEISLLAIGIPSAIAASSKQQAAHAYEEGLKTALDTVEHIDKKLTSLPNEEPTLNRLRCLVHLEYDLIAQALGKSDKMVLKRPAKTSRLAVASMKSRAPITFIKTTQGVQGELF